ncbi:4-Cys prefix domain-containing protein [Nodularia sphaerocarpa]|uniref:4-Cys prefix domain-containing protein n=1 Tax=Nodularia sphaerocarpa TaxID=137816 RepID=UPI001EFBDDEF|nr:4-Cys prefix domain-containing protein [Nodularia sphaerocarpa]MDB9375025.1 protein kinase [Nodularia sphaerocarpa CS-585]MDB9377189.1 protein kinase [Nodularia sphaerocarpa CS-585A2]ULP73362.1 Serine/threonine-protein kinase B [Nodularia sphaerocarpa UHCC 0038]
MSLCINPACPQPYHPDNQDRFCKSCGSPLELLGRYRVITLLSDKNGFSKVYAADEQNTPKILKVLNEELSNDAQAVELFCQEASLLEHLNHPEIPRFAGYFQYQTRNGLLLHCMVMEKIDQPHLDVWLKQQHNFVSQAQAVNWLKQFIPANLFTHSQINVNLPASAKHSEKVPLFALLTALFVSLGLLGLTALATHSPKFTTLATSAQSPQRKGTIDYFPYEEGMDSQGKIAKFNIAVLSVEYKWLTGSNFQIQYNDQIISLEILKLKLEQQGIQQIMAEPREIIAVGMANCGDNQAVQQRKALERAQQVQRLAKSLFRNTPSVQGYRLLNLGQFQESNCQENQDLTAYQKSVIIIGVKPESEGVIIDEALRDRLENKPFADFKLKDYSLGSVKDFITIPSQ